MQPLDTEHYQTHRNKLKFQVAEKTACVHELEDSIFICRVNANPCKIPADFQAEPKNVMVI